MGLGLSVFLSIYVTIAAMVLTIVYMIWAQRFKGVALYTPGIQYLWALCALGIVAAYDNNNTVGTLITVALAGSFLVGGFARSVMTRTLFDKLAAVICGASLLAFVVALAQYLIGADPIKRISSVFINANYYAAVTEMIVLLAIYKIYRAEGFRKKVFYAAVIMINSVGLCLSGCRTGMFALFAAASLMLALYRKFRTLALLWAFCIALAGLMIALPGVFPRMNQMGQDMDVRLEIWRRALIAISKHPLFGSGALAFSEFHFTVNGMQIVHAHSIYLETVLCFGVVGVALMFVYLKKNLTPIWQMRGSDRETFALTLGVLASVALHGVADATPFNVQTGMLIMLALSLAGIQEKLQPALVRVPLYGMAYLPGGEGWPGRGDMRPTEAKALYSKKSA